MEDEAPPLEQFIWPVDRSSLLVEPTEIEIVAEEARLAAFMGESFAGWRSAPKWVVERDYETMVTKRWLAARGWRRAA